MATNYILIGLGGTGGKVLRAFKMRMFEEFPDMEQRNKIPVSLLYVDSTRELMPKDGKPRKDFQVLGQDASFTESEFLDIKSTDIDYILRNPNNYPHLKGIIANADAVKKAIGALGEAAGQKRRAGRILFAANAGKYVERLTAAFARCKSISGSVENTNIFIITGLSGGTGSGSVIDAVVQARKTFPNAKIQVFAMLPEINLPDPSMDKGQYYPNAYAALNELNAMQAGRWNPWDVTGSEPAEVFTEKLQGVANGITLYSDVNQNGMSIDSLNELPKIIGDYLFARVFDIKDEDMVFHNLIRSFTCENGEKFAYEYDETDEPALDKEAQVARTKKINSFGIKRVIYPEMRILKHITYNTAEKILYQIKFNNWTENVGYVDAPKNRDFLKEYFNDANLSAWMIDQEHLTLEAPILATSHPFESFLKYWNDKAIGWADSCKNADCPLNALDNTLADFYASHFRDQGVEAYFAERAETIPALAKEIRHKIEHTLFQHWKEGKLSVSELDDLSKLLFDYVKKTSERLEEARVKNQDAYKKIEEIRQFNLSEWSNLGILQRMVGKGARLYAEHQTILADLYTVRTRIVALDFAIKLAGTLLLEIGRMDKDITSFATKINEAVKSVEALLYAQRKIHKGIEDLKGAIIEVSEEERIQLFEEDLCKNKIEMPNYAAQFREALLPETEFINFGKLADALSIDGITNTFDTILPEIIRQKHEKLGVGETKVLGLNILTQLQQKLPTDAAIKEFASKIAKQSGVYLTLDDVQMTLHLDNNEGDQSPATSASVNNRTVLISLPKVEKGNESQKLFVEKLTSALENEITDTKAAFNKDSDRKDELSIITIAHTFPMRAVEEIAILKKRYEKYTHSGNPSTDARNAILLHGEGTGENLPSLFAITDPAEVAAIRKAKRQQAGVEAGTPPAPSSAVPPMPPMPTPPMPPVAEKPISVTLAIGGATYGPYDRTMCKQLVANRQLTPETLVWMEGMPAWAPAGQVEELKSLFAPAVPPMPGMPPMPPATGSVPPPIV